MKQIKFAALLLAVLMAVPAGMFLSSQQASAVGEGYRNKTMDTRMYFHAALDDKGNVASRFIDPLAPTRTSDVSEDTDSITLAGEPLAKNITVTYFEVNFFVEVEEPTDEVLGWIGTWTATAEITNNATGEKIGSGSTSYDGPTGGPIPFTVVINNWQITGNPNIAAGASIKLTLTVSALTPLIFFYYDSTPSPAHVIVRASSTATRLETRDYDGILTDHYTIQRSQTEQVVNITYSVIDACPKDLRRGSFTVSVRSPNGSVIPGFPRAMNEIVAADTRYVANSIFHYDANMMHGNYTIIVSCATNQGQAISDSAVIYLEVKDFDLACDDATHYILAGEPTVFIFNLTNRGPTTTFSISQQNVPSGWFSSVSETTITLAHGAVREFEVAVAPKNGAVEGSRAVVTIKASAGGSSVSKEITAIVAAVPSYGLKAGASGIQPRQIRIGRSVVCGITVRNTGNTVDTYDLSIINITGVDADGTPIPTDGWEARRETTPPTVISGARGNMMVNISAPGNAIEGSIVSVAVKVASHGDPAKTAVVVLRLTPYALYNFSVDVLDTTHILRLTPNNGPPLSQIQRDAYMTETTRFRILIRNTGDTADTYVVACGKQLPDGSFALTYGQGGTLPERWDGGLGGLTTKDMPTNTGKITVPAGRIGEAYLSITVGSISYLDVGPRWVLGTGNAQISVWSATVPTNVVVINTKTTAKEGDMRTGQAGVYLEFLSGVANGLVAQTPSVLNITATDKAKHSIRVTNAGAEKDNIILTAIAPAGWNAVFDNGKNSTTFALQDQSYTYASKQIILSVTPPPGAKCGDRAAVEVVAWSSNKQAVYALLKPVTTINPIYNFSLSCVGNQTAVHPGEKTAYTIAINNLGNSHDTFDLEGNITNGTGWTYMFDSVAVSVPPYSQKWVVLNLTAPSGALPGTYCNMTVSVKSRGMYAYIAQTDEENASKKSTKSIILQARVFSPSNLTATCIDPPEAFQTIYSGQNKSYVIEIRNNGQTGRELTMSSAVPQGWNASFNATQISVEAGKSRRVYFTISPPQNALSGTVVSALIYASAGTISPASENYNTSFALAIVRASAAQKFGVALACAEPEMPVTPGGTASYLIRVTNTGNGRDRTALHFASLPSGWTGTFSRSEVWLEPDKFADIYVNVTASTETAVPGGRYVIDVVAQSAGDPAQFSRAALTAVMAKYEPGLSAEEELYTLPWENATALVRVFNNGTVSDILDITASASQTNDGEWGTLLSETQVALKAGQAANVVLTIAPPPYAQPETSSWIAITASSRKSPNAASTTSIRAYILDYKTADVDSDGYLEAAVDRNRNAKDGYEEFSDFSEAGRASSAFAKIDGDFDQRKDFLIEYTGDFKPDIYWDPDNGIQTKITLFIDADGDNKDEMLVDTKVASRDDDGAMEIMYDPDAGMVTPVYKMDADYDGRYEYLIDTTGDNVPDKYWNPYKNVFTPVRVEDVNGDRVQDWLVDPEGNGNYNTYYDPVYGMASHVPPFYVRYWYVFLIALFAAMAAAVVLVFARNARRLRQMKGEAGAPPAKPPAAQPPKPPQRIA